MGTDTFRLTIDSLSFGGRGVGRREDGKVVFVPGVLPGETIHARTSKEHPSYILATVEEVLEQSLNRIEPNCPLFPECGGCDWQHIAYPEQLKWKRKILADELSKVCGLSHENVLEPVQSDNIYGYRCHAIIQCVYRPDFTIGFFRKQSKDIVGFQHCPILNPQIQGILPDLREILIRNPIYNMYSLEVHAPQEDMILLARCKGTAHKKDIQTINRIYNELGISGISLITFGAKRRDHVLGQRYCRYDVKTRESLIHLSSGFGGFIQANMQTNDALVKYVMDLCSGSANVLDLFSGSGNFSIPVAYVSKEVAAIERNPRLVSQGKINAKKNNVKNVRFFCMDAKKAVESIKKEALDFDTTILDPPRQGARDVVQLVPKLDTERIIYISCNPSTLARDARILMDAGFSFKHTKMFDMFPQTYHIESVSYLERQ